MDQKILPKYCNIWHNTKELENILKVEKILFKNLHNDYNCFNDIFVYANPISVRLKLKRQRINTVAFYLRDISTPLVGVVFKHVDEI